MATGEDLQARIDAIVSGHRSAAASAPGWSQSHERRFSSFVNEDVERATELASEFMALAEAKGGLPGLSDAVDAMERAVDRETPGTVPYAVKLFLTHYPQAGRILQAEQ